MVIKFANMSRKSIQETTHFNYLQVRSPVVSKNNRGYAGICCDQPGTAGVGTAIDA